MTIATFTPTAIDAASLHVWLKQVMATYFPDKDISIIHRENEIAGEPCHFSIISADKPISALQLAEREVKDRSQGMEVHFYADDVVNAAVSEGQLEQGVYWLYTASILDK